MRRRDDGKTTGREDESVERSLKITQSTLPNKQTNKQHEQENKSIDAGMHGTILPGKERQGRERGKGKDGWIHSNYLNEPPQEGEQTGSKWPGTEQI